jgi:phosphatidylserine/phosphatidylglycerophosphate/cardiolipin synthase-like enzyme
MSKRMLRISVVALLATAISSYGQSGQELLGDLNLTDGNPLLPFALKGEKTHNKFKVPYETLLKYYQHVSQGYILPNDNPGPMMNIHMDVIPEKSIESLQFLIDLKQRKAYPTEVINPHSVSNIFILDPLRYTELANADDFLSAKRTVYSAKDFNSKKFKYNFKLIHLEDWRSLNHPPVVQLGDDLRIWDKNYAPIEYANEESIFYDVEFQRHIDRVSNTELTFGNTVELLENGLAFDRKITEVKKAKESILIAVMSFFCDASSRQLEDALIEKAHQGVDVKLMVEKVWTKLIMKKCLNRMMKNGIDVVLVNDLLKKNEEKALFHSKFMIIDGKVVIMGGSNIMDSENISTGYNHMNRDNDVVVEGPIATDATLAYSALWQNYTRKRNGLNVARSPRVKDITHYEEAALKNKQKEEAAGLRGVDQYSKKLNDKHDKNRGVCRFMNQSPTSDKNKLSKVLIEYINHAEKKLSMTNGNTFYFDLPQHNEEERKRETWNKKLFRSIFNATDRGVKLDVIGNGIDGGYGEASNMFKKMYLQHRFKRNPLPKTIASALSNTMDRIAARINQPFLEYLEKENNTRAWTHFQYMHAKKFHLDRLVSIVSSFNLEEWSADKSHESAIVCMDERLNRQMDRSFILDMVNSQPVSLTE